MVHRVYLTLASLLLVTVAYGQGGGGDSGGESDDPPSYYDKVVKGHAILASVSWVIFFPLGAVLMRLLSNPNTVRIHAAIQLFSTMVFTAAVGMGIWLARTTQQLGEYHPIIGLLIFGVIWLQIIGALVQHFVLFPKYKTRTALSIAHIWSGRILITLGMINGGLGLRLSDDAERGDFIAYGIISAVIWVAYVSVITYYEIKGPKESPEIRKEMEKNPTVDDSEAGPTSRASHEPPVTVAST